MTKFTELLEGANESIGAKRVFGAPYEKNGMTVIPAARIMGGMGGGEGKAPGDKEAFGSGGGFGVSGQPAGAYVIKGESVTWLPAVDVNRLLLGFQVVMIVILLVIRSIAKARARGGWARAEAET
jgi:uncharacterized spore protein YtfJ